MAALLELLEQVAKAAADDTPGSAAREQAAQSTLENIAKTSAGSAGHSTSARRWRRTCARWTAAQMLDCLVGEQRKDCHGHRRHPAARLRARTGGTARTLLHSVQYIE
jgi:hypothetical protein